MKKTLSIILATTTIFMVGVVYDKYVRQKEHNNFIQQPIISEQKFQSPQLKPKQYNLEEAVLSVKESDLKNGVDFLCSDELEGRMSGKKGNRLAADFLKKKYEMFGLPVVYQKFKIERVNPGPKHEVGDDFTDNVIAWVEGSDPKLKDEIVVVGAHFDHVGYGPRYSLERTRIREGQLIHPGADDNASGTSALLEVAEAVSLMKGQNKRTIVFISFSAEEMGCLGSAYYCNHPLFPRDKPSIKNHVAMINLDMVGNLNKATDKRGAFTKSEVRKFVLQHFADQLRKSYSFEDEVTSYGPSNSDHSSFYSKDVPVAFIHTGLHDGYHTPQDTPNKLDYPGMERISRYAFQLVWKAANEDYPQLESRKPLFRRLR